MAVVRGVCPHNCPDACGMLTRVDGTRAVRVTGDPSHPVSRGTLCVKTSDYVARVYHPDRVLHPMRRVGPKGTGQFVHISWREALERIAERWTDISHRHGPLSILPYSFSGTLGAVNAWAMDQRFWHRLGASSLQRSICGDGGREGLRLTVGTSMGADPEDLVNSRLVIMWGVNPILTNPHIIPMLRDVRARGGTVVSVNVYRPPVPEYCDWFIQPYPGTDGALALAMMHVIVKERLHDERFLADRTHGAELFLERLEKHTPEWAAAITRLSASEIRDLARLYATTKPGIIRTAQGIQRHTNGGMTIRTLAVLPALTGQYGVPGGGFVYTNEAYAGWNVQSVHHPELRRGPNRIINMNRIGEALLEADPPIMSLAVYNSNPAAIAPNQNRVLAGLAREDLFTVVHDLFLTDTARYADILLPATSQLEHLDLHHSYFHLYLRLNEPAIAPLGEARSNPELFRALAEVMRYDDPPLRQTAEEIAAELLATAGPYTRGLTLEDFRREGTIRLRTPMRPMVPFADGRFPTPSGKVELYSEESAGMGFDPLPHWAPPRESPIASPELFARYPLALVTPSARYFVNSSFANVDRNLQKAGPPTIWLNPEDATARGIADGDPVRVWNDRGECRLQASVGPIVARGVAVSESGRWPIASPGGRTVNAVTPDYLSDLANNSCFHSNLVEVARWPGETGRAAPAHGRGGTS